jgi:hypothetical protein
MQQQDNLVIDVNCLLRTTVLGEALSGSVYAEAYAPNITQPSDQLYIPNIQWIDRTHVTGNQQFSSKLSMFTPAAFTKRL